MNPNSTAPKSAEILLAKARHPVGFGVKRTCPFVLFAVIRCISCLYGQMAKRTCPFGFSMLKV